jgi:hypothetical protein
MERKDRKVSKDPLVLLALLVLMAKMGHRGHKVRSDPKVPSVLLAPPAQTEKTVRKGPLALLVRQVQTEKTVRKGLKVFPV